MATMQYVRYPSTGGGVGGITIGGTVTGGTPGSVLFVGAGPVLAQDNANFNFNDATNALFVGGTITGSNLSGTNTGDVTLTAVGSSPNANGASLAGQVLTLQPADGTNPGLLTSGAQSIGGAKTFTGAISASNLSGTNTGNVTLGTANGLSLVGQALSLGLSSTSTTGALSSTDWNTFNNVAANSANNTLSNLVSPTAINQNLLPDGDANRILGSTTNRWGGSFITSLKDNGGAISVDTEARSLKDNGGNPSLSWSTAGSVGVVSGIGFTFDGLTSGTFTLKPADVTTNYTVKMPGAQGASNTLLRNDGSGNLSWIAASAGTVTSVALTAPSIFTVSGSPVTTTGTLNFSLNSQTQNLFFASPNGSSGAPTFRAIVAADVPTLNQNTTGTASNITASSNATLTTLSVLSLPGAQVTGNISGNAGNVSGTVAIANGGTGQTTKAPAFNALSPMTTAGDIIIGGASGAGTRLPIGSNGNYLSVVAGAPAWVASSYVPPTSEVWITDSDTGANSYGTTNTVVRRFLTITTNTGTDITYADDAALGGSFTINSSGLYSIAYTDIFTGATYMGIVRNGTQGSTSVENITTATEVVSMSAATVNGDFASISTTLNLTSGDVIWIQNSSGSVVNGNATLRRFCSVRITKIA